MYAQNVIPEEKLIMGCPFYARAWANTNPARAYRFSTLCNVANEEKIDLNNVLYIDEIPTFIYEKKVNVTVFFENAKSNYYRLKMYKDLGITNVGFWCLGQEDVAVWNFLKVSL
jgi:spore germination protein YaaH